MWHVLVCGFIPWSHAMILLIIAKYVQDRLLKSRRQKGHDLPPKIMRDGQKI